MSLVLGTRGSELARAQAARVAALLGSDVEIRVVRTHGDDSTRSLRELGDGTFVTALEDALRRGEIDVAVHSLKDVPTDERPGLVIGAIPERADPRDVLVSRERLGLASLSPQARVGTGSPRRAAFLRALRPDLVCDDVRGNVDTRLAKVRSGEYEAVVLALAGLVRLGIDVGVDEILTLEEMLPAPGQAALALQCRAGDATTLARVDPIDDLALRLATDAERALLRELGGSCELPLGAYAVARDGTISLHAALALDGAEVRRTREVGTSPLALARRAALRLAGSARVA
ncbi:MAG: hydroxymethylbilane synthase [Chloroflexi bacterium 13_1_40CM_4_68_4]|nr:MAG: hydroxymethylbilane synthase [Chloroflexi bacterium 13_1_40CM_4_68_4]